MKTVIYKSDSDGVTAVGKASPLPTMVRDYDYEYIASAKTTQVKSSAGFLHSITVNSTAAGTIKVIDGTSGSTANIATLKASVGEGTYTYDVEFSTGLRIITAAASDITVSYI